MENRGVEWSRYSVVKPPVAAGRHLAVHCQVREVRSFHLAGPKSGLLCVWERVPQCYHLLFFCTFLSTILWMSTWDNCSLIGWQEMKTVSTLCGIISFLPSIRARTHGWVSGEHAVVQFIIKIYNTSVAKTFSLKSFGSCLEFDRSLLHCMIVARSSLALILFKSSAIIEKAWFVFRECHCDRQQMIKHRSKH